MRVITGAAKGRSLITPPGNATRPTAQRVKEAVFSSLQFDIAGQTALDLFAGSGQMGIEALSRGALHCDFVDSAAPACRAVTANLASAGFGDCARVYRQSAQDFLLRAGEYGLIFLDPPYRLGVLPGILPQVAAHTCPGGTVVCETAAQTILPEQIGGLTAQAPRRYGKTAIVIYRRL